MTAKRIATATAALALAALLALGLTKLPGVSHTAQSGRTRLTALQLQTRLAGSPPPLAALHRQAGALLDGGPGALRMRLAALHGWPVVVNKWASWCQPCRAELGAFQRVSADLGRRVAFLGVDSGDGARAEAQALMRSIPVGYPSYYDPSGRLGEAITDSPVTPVTVIYDRRGARYIHQGPYASPALLRRDVERYGLGA